MCGIFGCANFEVHDLGRAISSLQTMAHRGPDQWGEWHDDDVFIGHNRLSIMDVSEDGKQPMCDISDSVIAAVNGEIYNYKTIHDELKSKYVFRSKSDSEVVLYGYIEWGIDKLLELIDGMYTFVIYDKNINSIFIARDRYGIKPVYYMHNGSKLLWSSELKGIVEYVGSSNLEFNHEALYDYLTYLYVPTPKTLYKDVKKLEPASYIKYDLSSDSIEFIKYWELSTEVIDISIDEAKIKLNKLLKKSVNEQMMSDVPVGFFLSGGVDSSLIVSLASRCNDSIQTFSIGFTDKTHDETLYSTIVSKENHTNHHEKILDVTDVLELYNKTSIWFDEPFADNSAFPTYLVSEFAREHVSVVLTGDGADEVFGGFNYYYKFRELNKKKSVVCDVLKNISISIKSKLNSRFLFRGLSKLEYLFLLSDIELLVKMKGGMLKAEKKKYAELWGIDNDYDDYWYFRRYYRDDLSVLTRLQYLDFHTYLPDDILTKVDRTSMSVSLEARVPFLSKEVVEFSFSLPEAIRFHGNQQKGLIKDAFNDYLPDEIITRSKKGFSVPQHTWHKEMLDNEDTYQERILRNFI